MKRSERVVRADGVELATEAFGNPGDRPLLLVMGVMASMLWWAEDFCARPPPHGRFVIRYDNRDTGLSSGWPVGAPDYSFDDMADDAIRILDAYGIETADVVGMSMGGMIAQLIAIMHPSRVRTLTLMSTSPYGMEELDLPRSTEAYQKHSAEGENVDWTDLDQVAAFILSDTRAIAGSAFPYDEAAARDLIKRDMARAKNFASVTNHFVLKHGRDVSGQLAAIPMPLLVIHGTEDPIFPIAHGEAFQAILPDARLLRLEHGGHELHPSHWDQIVDAITNQ